MGHLLLGDLPRTRRWREVIALVESGASYEEIAKASLIATRDAFAAASDEPGLVEAFWLLTQLPIVCKQRDIIPGLTKLGLVISRNADLLEIITSADQSVERTISTSTSATDLSEMARLAFADALAGWASSSSLDLFGTPTEEARQSLKRLATNKAFSAISREFFTRFLVRHLLYFLSRELSNHVGPNRPFQSIEQHGVFNAALELHCHEATRIVSDFAGGWYTKAQFEGEITRRKVRGFLHVALDKITKELLREGPRK